MLVGARCVCVCAPNGSSAPTHVSHRDLADSDHQTERTDSSRTNAFLVRVRRRELLGLHHRVRVRHHCDARLGGRVPSPPPPPRACTVAAPRAQSPRVRTATARVHTVTARVCVASPRACVHHHSSRSHESSESALGLDAGGGCRDRGSTQRPPICERPRSPGVNGWGTAGCSRWLSMPARKWSTLSVR